MQLPAFHNLSCLLHGLKLDSFAYYLLSIPIICKGKSSLKLDGVLISLFRDFPVHITASLFSREMEKDTVVLGGYTDLLCVNLLERVTIIHTLTII